FLLPLAAVIERGRPAQWTPAAVGSLVYLAVFGTALTFAGLFWLIKRVPISVVSTIPLVDTMIAVVLGAIVLGERLPVRTFAGGALILAGVVLAARTSTTEVAAGA
ncbi:MAG TPA: EamA family transporter, partial [Thermoanaerobaculia bacterium]|nr:EamA family transporter [Thermoanaerobaculia bacterium]